MSTGDFMLDDLERVFQDYEDALVAEAEACMCTRAPIEKLYEDVKRIILASQRRENLCTKHE